MKLFLLRHGLAGERDPSRYPTDAVRPLTTDGKHEILRIAKRLRREKIRFDLIISSPYTRARQTAEIVARIYKMKVKLTDHLTPEGKMRDLIQYLGALKGAPEAILLVGHEPYLTQLISILLSGKDNLDIRLKKAGLCRLTIGFFLYGRCARLDWLLTPEQLAV
ncbi:MAG TPA: phosphohistidine phosphatase SixA [Tepidisphaeraceae bacterium]|jgi:phosphohistidine phosphatase|nr:phosphohistidine phosphatase SixA [Tepidisphaeraceae bacterium]